MRRLALVLAAATVLVASSCASGGSASRSPTVPQAEAGAGVRACDEVVLGIDAFNQGDFEATVAHFVKAVPLAEAELAADDSPAAEDLLDAVRYYADLAPEDYLDASATSPEFAKYKAITLGQCAGDGPSDAPGELA